MKRLRIFLIGGFGCIAPNVINYASSSISGGAISGNIMGILLGGLIFFGVSGFLVTYILEARDIKDAFYKGVAVPTLIISLANGVGVTTERPKASVILTVPTEQISMIQPDERGNSFFTLVQPKIAYADNGKQTKTSQGTVEFNITPKDAKGITVSIISPDGSEAAHAYSDTSSFKLDYFSGEYTAIIETNNYYKEIKLKIEDKQITKIDTDLEPKGIMKQFSRGVQSLMKKR
ncbi:MAG: hypothetical protein A2889_10090 [Nitrospinae bacterium RIFCSPLOWO2_01_FULL_39_10]|nr:MAG: hypothetical protein A2889_10090 [Nitrospinae bacterium RIFCSPLOWO2_01_FULL_39_10]